MRTLIAMSAVLASWVVVFVAQAGLGYLVSLAVRRAVSSVVNAFWIGFAALLGFLQIWQIIFPIDLAAVVVPAGAGAAGAAIFLRRRPSTLRSLARRVLRWHVAVAAIVSVLLAGWFLNESIRSPHVYDSGLYHLQAVRWLQDYRLVPGLADLHSRLGFGSASLLYVAELGVGPWRHGGHHVANSLLAAVLAFDLANRSRPVLRLVPTPASVTAILMLPPLVIRGVQQIEMSSPSLDLPAFVVIAAALPRVIAWRQRRTESTTRAEDGMTGLVLVSLAPILRLQLAPLVLIALAAFVVCTSGSWRRRVLVLAPVVVLMVPWVVRSIIVSGYPAFPASFAGVDVPWRVPRTVTAATANDITAWARRPGPGYRAALHGWNWLGSWWRRNEPQPDLKWPLILTAAAATLVVARLVGQMLARRTHSRLQRPSPMHLAIVAGCLVTVCAWFYSGPDLRFAWGPIWGAAASMCAAAAMIGATTRRAAMISSAALLVVVVVISGSQLRQLGRHGNFLVVRGVDGTATHVAPDPAANTRIVLVRGGTVRVPVEDDRCWTAPLPCTPYVIPGLRYRSAHKPEDGFEIQR